MEKFPNDDIKDARVLLTIIQAGSDSDFGRSVTKARNHQNPVTAGNFAALDPAQENLRRELDYEAIPITTEPDLPTGSGKNPAGHYFELAMRSLAMFGTDSHFPFWLKNEPDSLSANRFTRIRIFVSAGTDGLNTEAIRN